MCVRSSDFASLLSRRTTLRTIKFLPITAALIALLLPGVALAQSNSTVAGQVTDATCGVFAGSHR